MNGPEKQERFLLCVHESGHAVIAHELGAVRITNISVHEQFGGYVNFSLLSGRRATSRTTLEKAIIHTQAGHIARDYARDRQISWRTCPAPSIMQRMAQALPVNPAANDRPEVGQHVQKVAGDGGSDPEQEMRLATILHPGVEGPFLYFMGRRTAQLVTTFWPKIHAVAAALFWRGTLTGRAFRSIIKNVKIIKEVRS